MCIKQFENLFYNYNQEYATKYSINWGSLHKLLDTEKSLKKEQIYQQKVSKVIKQYTDKDIHIPCRPSTSVRPRNCKTSIECFHTNRPAYSRSRSRIATYLNRPSTSFACFRRERRQSNGNDLHMLRKAAADINEKDYVEKKVNSLFVKGIKSLKNGLITNKIRSVQRVHKVGMLDIAERNRVSVCSAYKQCVRYTMNKWLKSHSKSILK